MKVIIFQQGSGSRILSAYLWGEVAPEPFAVKPQPSESQAKDILRNKPNIRLSYRHLEAQPWLYEMLKDYEVIHLYRDPGRTFTREMAKYKEKKSWTREELKDYIKFVLQMRDKVNSKFRKIIITHYEDFIKDLYRGDLREFNHLGELS